MTSQPFTTVAHVMAEVDKLAELHAQADRAHVEAAGQSQARKQAPLIDTVEDENVQ